MIDVNDSLYVKDDFSKITFIHFSLTIKECTIQRIF